MNTFFAQSAEVVIHDGVLLLTRKKIGTVDVRRIPLRALTDIQVKSGGRFAPAMLQLVLNNEPPAAMRAVEPNTLLFPSTGKYAASFEALRTTLQEAIERNRAEGVDPAAVAFDAPRKSWLDRVADSAKAATEQQRGRQGDTLTADLVRAGITRPDLVAAANATATMFGLSPEIPRLAALLRADELLLRATRATFRGAIGLVALTDSRLIILDSTVHTTKSDEFVLSAVLSVGSGTEMFTNDLTIRLRSGADIELSNVDDRAGFAAVLRDAVHQAVAPAQPQHQARPDVLDQLAKLGELRDAGVVTDAEFQIKKAELLERL